MPLKHLAVGLAIVAIAIPAVFTSAQAGDGLYVPFFTYRTVHSPAGDTVRQWTVRLS